MLFRNSDGKLTEIKKNDYTRDNEYYKKIMITKQYITKQYDCKQHILNIVNNTFSKNI